MNGPIDLKTAVINGVSYSFEGWDPATDIETNPVCRMGEYNTQMDETSPGDTCCRVYSQHSFQGAMWEFCGKADGVKTEFDLGSDNDLWGKNWYKEISSYKCGKEI